MAWTMNKTMLAFGFLLVVAACHPGTSEPRSKMGLTSTEVASDVCETAALAEEHRTLTSRIGSIESGAPTTYHDEAWTILMEKMKAYRAEIDATYRFVTSNCKAYNLCMQAHKYAESECFSSRQEWTRSHEKFNQLALDLAMLEVPPKPHHPGGNGPHVPPCGNGPCSNQPAPCNNKCNVQGSVFTTGCSATCRGDGD